ncbi:Cysteine-rich secretory proteins, Antigen 5, and Pathogenesis-related 1 protein superfamily protein [Prunus dulcis]|uniref:Cysteine-rich secretory proteins, Antigen 5, and Pathogenesis-related 1 protein superfamily protein n=1 Tax=Prunus dulcis TaxID=3755 RepID=A0A4Y1QTT5_PRUDU|nr:Cysteine-rich secretory proteins, Antigen 5, and Pathogenesis-related 1 protein superfamily protein [Prunus dulcis]
MSMKQKMAFNTKLLLAICCVALVFTLVFANISEEEIDGFVEEHNKARKEVGNKPLKWNTTLAQYAQEYADKRVGDCAMEHSMGRWGENLASGDGMSGAAATKYWVTEKEFYDEKSNKCVKDECGHYLAVVWGKTTEVGCGISKCNNGQNYVVCSYDPIVTTIGFLSFAATNLLVTMRASVPTRIGRHLIKLMTLRWWTGTWNRLDVVG